MNLSCDRFKAEPRLSPGLRSIPIAYEDLRSAIQTDVTSRFRMVIDQTIDSEPASYFGDRETLWLKVGVELICTVKR